MRTREEMLAIKISDIAEGCSCGVVQENTGRRMQKHKGQWLYELVFLCDIDKDYILRIWETREGSDNAWKRAINYYLNRHGFKHPIGTIYCYNCDIGMITSRRIDLEFKIEETNVQLK